jgi:hypothetical protein
MNTSRVSTVSVLIVALSLVCVLTGCDGDGGGGAPPEDISGTWSGTIRQGTIIVPWTATLVQNGSTVQVNWTGEYPVETLHGTFTGSYSDGVFTATENGAVLTLHFSGNSASGTLSDSGGTANVSMSKV